MITKVNRFFTICITTALVFASSIVYAYSDADLNAFKTTGTCINCDLSGARFSGIDHANLTNTNLSAAFIIGSMIAATFDNANLTATRFIGLDMSHSSFKSANLNGTDFTAANLSNANFTGAHFSHISLYQANLCGAIISNSQLKNAEIDSGTIMPNCNYYQS